MPDSRQRPCARAQRCRSSETTISDDGETVTTPALGYDTFCQADRNAIARALGAIPELWVRVHQELPVKAPGGEHVTMSRTAPVPPNLAADALLREVSAVLCSWDEAVRLAAGLTLPDTQLARQRRDAPVIAASVRTLTAHLDRLLALPLGPMSRSFELHDLEKIPEGCFGRTNTIGGYAEVTVDLSGADAGEEILGLAYRCRAFLGETRMVERLEAPCPDPTCDSFTLVRVQGSEYSAECSACGRLMSAGELSTWSKIFTAGLTLADIPAGATEQERARIAGLLDERAFKVALRGSAPSPFGSRYLRKRPAGRGQVAFSGSVPVESHGLADRLPTSTLLLAHRHNSRIDFSLGHFVRSASFQFRRKSAFKHDWIFTSGDPPALTSAGGVGEAAHHLTAAR